jgi:hypothetical protein
MHAVLCAPRHWHGRLEEVLRAEPSHSQAACAEGHSRQAQRSGLAAAVRRQRAPPPERGQVLQTPHVLAVRWLMNQTNQRISILLQAQCAQHVPWLFKGFSSSPLKPASHNPSLLAQWCKVHSSLALVILISSARSQICQERHVSQCHVNGAIRAGVYERLMLAGSSEKELEIVRDLSRTYPSHVYYQQRQGPGQRSLFNVLRAYSVYDRQVRPLAHHGWAIRRRNSVLPVPCGGSMITPLRCCGYGLTEPGSSMYNSQSAGCKGRHFRRPNC